MYGKFFASAFTGSMFGAGADVFAVWGYVIAHTVDGTVELNSPVLGAALGMAPEQVEAAIAKLTAPDPKSRNPDELGRRLVHEGGFQYRVVSHQIYKALRNEEERRAYNRDAQRKSRSKRKLSLTVSNVSRGQPPSAHTEAEAEAEAEAEEEEDAREKIQPAAAPKPKQRPKPKTWTIVPADWEPKPKHLELAQELGVNSAVEVQKFRECEFKVPKTSADLAYFRWLRRAPDFAAQKQGQLALHRSGKSLSDSDSENGGYGPIEDWVT